MGIRTHTCPVAAPAATPAPTCTCTCTCTCTRHLLTPPPLLLLHQAPLPFPAIPVTLTMTPLLIRSLTQVQRLKLWQLLVCLFPILLQGQAVHQLQWLHPPQWMCQHMTMQWLIQNLTLAPPRLLFWLR